MTAHRLGANAARSAGASTVRVLFAVLCCVLCAVGHSDTVTRQPPPSVPRYVHLGATWQVATLHFPAGRYAYAGRDRDGFYYRAPRPILQHTGGSSMVRDGGIFVSRDNPANLRGYVFLAGALTHVGNLSRVPHEFGN